MEISGINFSIEERGEEDVVLSICFLPEYEYFQGHFEDFKLLAALIQIKVSIDFANELFPISLNPTSIPKMKFSNPIKPGVKLKLKLKWDREKERVTFEYFANNKTFSLGEMKI